MKCPYCGGRGWAWRGIASNAERALCEPCNGSGEGRPAWGPLAGLLIVLFSFVVTLGLILWASTAAFGGSAGSVTLKQFRAYPEQTRVSLVMGAMATTEHAGLACPPPVMTVAEYAAALQSRAFDETRPWIVYYFQLIDERGCKVEEDTVKEGA